MENKSIYLDNNATTFLAPEVRAALRAHLDHPYGNPSSVHRFGQEARATLSYARRTIARVLACLPSEIIFTSGGTEALNLCLRGLVKSGQKIVTTEVEHAAVYETVRDLSRHGVSSHFLSVGSYGAPELSELEAVLEAEDVGLIVLSAVNTETGVRIDLQQFAERAQFWGVPFIVDGVGLVGRDTFTLHPGITAFCASGHKIHGPKGIGFAYIRRGIRICPQMTGGSHESSRRAGTENLPGIVALAKAVELLETALPEAAGRMGALRDRLETGLLEAIEGTSVNGNGPRICNTLNMAFDGVDGESLLMNLAERGLAISHGSACSAGTLQPSRVLLKMGVCPELASASMRFSLSRYSTEEEVDLAIHLVQSVVATLRPGQVVGYHTT